MASKELLDYANSLLAKGYSFEQIKDILKKNNYPDDAIEELKTSLKNKEKTKTEAQPQKKGNVGKKLSFFTIFKTPEDYFNDLKQGANFKEPLIMLLLIGFISGILSGVSALVTQFMMKSMGGSLVNGIFNGPSLAISIISGIIQGSAGSILGGLFYAGILFLFIRLFKGKGRYVELFHGYAHYTVATMLFMILVFIIAGTITVFGATLPSIKTLVMVITLLIMLYSIYYILFLLTMLIKSVSGLSTLKSVLVWLIPTLVMILLVSLLFMVLLPLVLKTLLTGNI